MEILEKRIETLKNLDLSGIGESRVVSAEVVDAPFEEGGWTMDVTRQAVRLMLESKPGKRSYVRHEAWLPAQWNGVFVGRSNGGMAGKLHPESLCPISNAGYAVIQTDMGTSRGRESGVNNPDVWKDFGWRATRVMTLLGKAVVEAFYGRAADKSYFVGMSTGGQQAMAEALRYPEDYDGIIAGVPANNRTHLHAYFLWNHNHLTDADGNGLFADDEITFIADSAAEFFQSRGDGEPGDNFVSFPEADAQTIEAFTGFLKEKRSAFTERQLDALRAIYSGAVNPETGKRLYNGMPIGSEIYGCGIGTSQGDESPHLYPFVWAFGEGYTGRTFNFASDMDRLDELLADDLNAVGTDLSAFSAHGGKLLLYSGSCDPCVPFPDALAYTERLYRDNPNAAEFVRYFLIPGRSHGGDGRGFSYLMTEDGGDELELLRQWREQGKTPDEALVRRADDSARRLIRAWSPERPLGKCPPTWEPKE